MRNSVRSSGDLSVAAAVYPPWGRRFEHLVNAPGGLVAGVLVVIKISDREQDRAAGPGLGVDEHDRAAVLQGQQRWAMGGTREASRAEQVLKDFQHLPLRTRPVKLNVVALHPQPGTREINTARVDPGVRHDLGNAPPDDPV